MGRSRGFRGNTETSAEKNGARLDEVPRRYACGFGGLALGGATLAPLVLAVERAPATQRGRYATTLAAFNAVGGVLFLLTHGALALTAAGLQTLEDPKGDSVGAQWRSAAAVAAVAPFAAAVATGRGLAESFRWLASTKRHAQCRREVRDAARRNFGATPNGRRVAALLEDALPTGR